MAVDNPVVASAPQRPTGSSALAREVRRLKLGQRSAIGITDEAILLWDAIVSCAAILIDDTDNRMWQERVGDLLESFFGDNPIIAGDRIERSVSYVAQFVKQDLPKWAADLKKDGPRRFLVRMLGAATYRRCAIALQSDGATLTIALQRANRSLLPYVVALDDLYQVLPSNKETIVPGLTGTPSAALSLALQLDQLFEDKARDWGFPIAQIATQEADGRGLHIDDITSFAEQLRKLISGRSRQVVADLSAALSRKINGARHALEFSDDAVAQAANSLTELLDRILRVAFTDGEVLAWTETNYPEVADMVYVPKDSATGTVRPTKRAQALCFAHAGLAVEQPSPIHELAAAAIVATRSGLQKLKHDDRGSPEEIEELGKYLAAVEGYLALVIGFVWAAAPSTAVEQFRMRLESAR